MPSSPPAAPKPDTDALAQLRRRIDAIDADMHGLLIERSTIIDALIAAKGTQAANAGGKDAPAGAAFRPLREADMMRRLVERHEGSLPITTLEHIWREIMSTFTALQADYVVHLDGGADAIAMRDAARFYFGFSLDLVDAADADAVVAAVAGSTTDLGVIALSDCAETPWWNALGCGADEWSGEEAGAGGNKRPRILARLPFMLSAGRRADLPCLVLSPPVSEPGDADIRVFATGWDAGARPDLALADAGVEILSRHAGTRVSALLAVPGDSDGGTLDALMTTSGIPHDALREVGGYAAAIDLDDDDDF